MSKQLLFDALKAKKTERVPWVPFVGCHGGFMIGEDAETYLKSGDLMVKGVKKAIEKYRPDGVPVTFDLQIEAEALGCELQWSKENPPAVVSHVLEQKSLDDLNIPDVNSGRFPEVLKAAERLVKEAGDVAVYGLITGPFTLALHLAGTNIFMDMYDEPEKVNDLMKFTTAVGKKVADMYIDAGCDIIAVVDPMTSQISPDTFRQFVTPYATEIFHEIRERETFSSFFVCGHAQKNVEAMCETKPDNVSVDENIPLDFVKQVCQDHGLSFGGNLQLTVVLLMGTEDDVRRDVIECMTHGGDTGFILAPGCDLPYGVPQKNLELVADIVHDPYQQDVARELMRTTKVTTIGMNLSDYGQSDKVIVDVITLDSQSCAPCQYMVEAVKEVTPHFKDLVIWREHTIKEKESVEFMMGLMVRNIPTICIDGQIRFVSTIPSRDELIAAIQERINEKFKLKISQKKNRLLVLGAGCDKCEETWKNVQQAAKELGTTVQLVQVKDEKKIHEFGVSSTPAIISIEENVKSQGRVPSVEVIKEWIKDLE